MKKKENKTMKKVLAVSALALFQPLNGTAVSPTTMAKPKATFLNKFFFFTFFLSLLYFIIFPKSRTAILPLNTANT